MNHYSQATRYPKENRLEYKDFKDFLKEIISADKMIVHFTQHEVQLFESNLGLKMEPEKFMDIHKLVNYKRRQRLI